jgi:hypothetical protein
MIKHKTVSKANGTKKRSPSKDAEVKRKGDSRVLGLFLLWLGGRAELVIRNSSWFRTISNLYLTNRRLEWIYQSKTGPHLANGKTITPLAAGKRQCSCTHLRAQQPVLANNRQGL